MTSKEAQHIAFSLTVGNVSFYYKDSEGDILKMSPMEMMGALLTASNGTYASVDGFLSLGCL
jgi:hypothetical protein